MSNGDSNNVPFGLDVVHATYDTMTAITHFRNWRIPESPTQGWVPPGTTINTAKTDQGGIPPNSWQSLAATGNGANVKNVFDGNTVTNWDGYPFPDFPNGYIMYKAPAPTLLTDYQIVWHHYSVECPTSWNLYGSEGTTGPTELNGGGGMDWTLVHVVGTPRTEPDTFKYLNFTVGD